MEVSAMHLSGGRSTSMKNDNVTGRKLKDGAED